MEIKGDLDKYSFRKAVITTPGEGLIGVNSGETRRRGIKVIEEIEDILK